TYIAGIVAVSVTIANLVDFQYNDIIDKSISNPDEVTAFLGLWLSNLSLISLAVQLFLTNRILKTLGVGATLFFLPIGILVGAVAILFNPTLWSAISVKIADGSLKQSINKAGLELLYLPVPSSIKPQIKAFIDVFVDSLSTGLSGVLLIVCTAVFGFQVGEISIITIALIGVWIFLIVRIRSEYTQAFRTAIEKRTINLAEQDVNLDDASMFKNLLEILSGDNKRQILYVLDLLDNVTHPSFVPHLRRLLKHDDPEIRKKALELTMQYAMDDFSEDVRPMLKAENQQLRTMALDYLFRRSDDKVAFLQKYIEDEDYHLRAAALLCLSSSRGQFQGLEKEYDQAIKERTQMLLERLESESPDADELVFMKSHIAQAIGMAKIPELNPYLHELFKDEFPEVVAAAARGAGDIRAPEFIEILIDLLDRKQVKQHAREALAAFGEQAIPSLVESLNLAETRRGVRLVIPRVIAMIGTQKSVDVLTDQLGKSDLFLRYQIIKSLSNIRREFPLLKFNDTAIEEHILQECRSYIQMLNVLNAQHKLGMERLKSSNGRQEAINNARALLIKALEEKLDDNLERVFRLLGLRYEQKDMLNAYLGIVSEKQDLRANAVEFLDNVLDASLKRFIIPIVENASLSQLIEVARSQLNITVVDESQCLRELLRQSDVWLQACTVFLIGQLQDISHKDDIEALPAGKNSVLGEAIDFTMQQLQSAKNE
ncbi:MAG: HEAT repeat domain-containing protein, partial [Calditrichota bacterium]